MRAGVRSRALTSESVCNTATCATLEWDGMGWDGMVQRLPDVRVMRVE